MCIICVSKKGIRQPNKNELKTMFSRNPDGAGYMVARNGKVEIHKGFMSFDEFMKNINGENFTNDDVVIYHFRISTQGGVNREMCHPFPLSDNLETMKALDVNCAVGIAHNGIIPMTCTRNKEYSDTALFIAQYLNIFIRNERDLHNDAVMDVLNECIRSKMAILDRHGYVALCGDFIEEKSGLLFSNTTYKAYTPQQYSFKNTKYLYGMCDY